MNEPIWHICKCGLSNLFTYRSLLSVSCPQCNSPIEPVKQQVETQLSSRSLKEVFTHLEQDIYRNHKPKVFGKYKPSKGVHVAMSV